MINILIRTSERPKCFQTCIESIKKQTYKKLNIIVGSDSKNTYLQKDYGINFKVVQYKRLKKTTKIINTAKHFPYNLYFNELYKHCKEGYIIILDDDDILTDPQSLQSIIRHTNDKDNLIIFKTRLDGRIVPNANNWSRMPVCKDFSSLNMSFHTKYIPFAQWSEYKQGDYRVAWNLWGVIPRKQYINEVLTGSQKGEGKGMREDVTKLENKTGKPRILVMTPLHKRPEIFELFIKGFKKLNPPQIDLQLLCILSEKDQNVNELKYLLKSNNIDYCYYPNEPLGRKMNAGLSFALENYDFDYLMNLDSDGVVNPRLFDYYLPYIYEGKKFFGVNTYYALEWKSKKCLKFKIEKCAICSGRMIHRSILEYFRSHEDYIYNNKTNDGMDAISSENVKSHGFKELILDIDEPMILDIKTNTQISHFMDLEEKSYCSKMDYNDIKDYFDYE